MPADGRGFETRQIHAGAAPDPTTGARATAIGSIRLETIEDILADLDAGFRAAKS